MNVLLAIIVLSPIILFLLIKLEKTKKELEKNSNELSYAKNSLQKATEQIIENAQKPIIIWKIEKYTQQDVLFLWKNPEFIQVLLKYLEYNIAIKTDTMRNTNDWLSIEEKAGYANALHSVHLFLYKILNKQPEKKEYEWKDLV